MRSERPSVAWITRFWSKVALPNEGGCMLWLAYCSKTGYGQFNGTPYGNLAHRISYSLLIGPIDPGLVIDHACRVRSCVAPNHLRAVTQRENVLADYSESLAKKHSVATECPQGHPYEGKNLYLDGGSRQCRVCSRERAKQYYYQRKGNHGNTKDSGARAAGGRASPGT